MNNDINDFWILYIINLLIRSIVIIKTIIYLMNSHSIRSDFLENCKTYYLKKLEYPHNAHNQVETIYGSYSSRISPQHLCHLFQNEFHLL